MTVFAPFRVAQSCCHVASIASITAAVAAVLMVARLSAQQPTSLSAAELKRVVQSDTSVIQGVLPNGLHYYVKKNSYPAHRAELRLVVNAGSILEDDTQRGLAHILEHMAFDGSTHFPKHALWDYLERVGLSPGADLNAETSFDETVYKLTIPTDSVTILAQGIQAFEDIAHGLTLDSAEFVRERPVVIEEWRLLQGPGQRIFDQEVLAAFHGSRYADRMPIGTKASLDGAQLADVRRFYHDWYRPNLMAVVIVGDIDPQQMVGIITQHFTALQNPKNAPERMSTLVPLRSPRTFVVVTDSSVGATSVTVNYLRPRTLDSTVAWHRKGFFGYLYMRLLNERLGDVAQRKNPPFLGANVGFSDFMRDHDSFGIGVATTDGGATRGLDAVVAEMQRTARYGFTQPELDRLLTNLKTAQDQRYAARERMPSVLFVNDIINRYLMQKPNLDVETRHALDTELRTSVTLEEVNAAAKSILTDYADSTRVVTVEAPAGAAHGAAIPDTAAFFAVFTAPRADLTAYASTVDMSPLVPQLPKRGHVVSEKTLDSLGTTQWMLSNGIRVMLKPTTFDKEQVMVRAYRHGGTSLAPDSLWVPSSTASALVGGSGVGPFDRPALGKRLTGKSAGVSAGFGLYDESISGGAVTRDLETFFQLFYLTVTAPRIDSAVMTQTRASLAIALRTKGTEPEGIFGDTMRQVSTNYDWHFRPLDEKYVAAVDAQRSMAFYKQRMRDLSGYTIVIVGAFSPEKIRPLVEQYVASLPTSGHVINARDLKIAPPPGVTNVVVHAGTDPKSSTTIAFSGVAPMPSIRDERVIWTLANVLQQRLWERMRQKMSGTYGVIVGGTIGTYPTPRYDVGIQFGADPTRVDSLIAAVFDEIAKLKTEGPTAVEMEKANEEFRRSIETASRENGYWIGSIIAYDQNKWPLNDIPRVTQVQQQVTAAQVKAAAEKYLDTKQYVRGTLLPAATPSSAPATAPSVTPGSASVSPQRSPTSSR